VLARGAADRRVCFCRCSVGRKYLERMLFALPMRLGSCLQTVRRKPQELVQDVTPPRWCRTSPLRGPLHTTSPFKGRMELPATYRLHVIRTGPCGTFSMPIRSVSKCRSKRFCMSTSYPHLFSPILCPVSPRNAGAARGSL